MNAIENITIGHTERLRKPVGYTMLANLVNIVPFCLAEHLRKLSLGFLSRRDPGDLSSMLITDFTMAETGISHHLPQLMGALVMPVLAFLGLLWIDLRMAVAMFIALPLAVGILLGSTYLQYKLSGKQIAAKINAGNRLEEYG